VEWSLTGLVTSIQFSVLESLNSPLIKSFTFGYIHQNNTRKQELNHGLQGITVAMLMVAAYRSRFGQNIGSCR